MAKKKKVPGKPLPGSRACRTQAHQSRRSSPNRHFREPLAVESRAESARNPREGDSVPLRSGSSWGPPHCEGGEARILRPGRRPPKMAIGLSMAGRGPLRPGRLDKQGGPPPATGKPGKAQNGLGRGGKRSPGSPAGKKDLLRDDRPGKSRGRLPAPVRATGGSRRAVPARALDEKVVTGAGLVIWPSRSHWRIPRKAAVRLCSRRR